MNDIRVYMASRPALNINALAREIGISANAFHAILNGGKPRKSTLSKITSVLYRYGYLQR